MVSEDERYQFGGRVYGDCDLTMNINSSAFTSDFVLDSTFCVVQLILP